MKIKHEETYNLCDIANIKYKKSKTLKECLRRINLLIVSRDKCNNGIK